MDSGQTRAPWEDVMAKKTAKKQANGGRRLRSQMWFNNPDNPGMTAIYLERYLNYALTTAELTAGNPIIGIAQTGSDLSPCNRHHLELAHRVREGIRSAGGIAFEFPVHPIQETGKRPTAARDRALGRTHAQRLVEGRARRLRHRGLGGAPGACRRPDRLQGIHRSRHVV